MSFGMSFALFNSMCDKDQKGIYNVVYNLLFLNSLKLSVKLYVKLDGVENSLQADS